MKNLILTFSILVAFPVFAGPNINANLPSVSQEANQVIKEMKNFNPLADCFNGSMFTSQSPTTSIKQISTCVSQKINNLSDLPNELKTQTKDIPNMGFSQLLKLKTCFDSLENMKNCKTSF